jgi:hypothetical protein
MVLWNGRQMLGPLSEFPSIFGLLFKISLDLNTSNLLVFNDK